MRVLTVIALLFLAACSTAGAPVAHPIATASPVAPSSPTARPSPTGVAGCAPTATRDTSGVITNDGRVGIVGETFAVGDLLNGGTHVVRRGAITGDQIAVRFDQIGRTAPATWVAYGVTAAPLATPWGDAAFMIGWKPIAFEDSCWRLVVDGVDTGIVLAVGR